MTRARPFGLLGRAIPAGYVTPASVRSVSGLLRSRSEIASAAQAVMAKALTPALRDDRFDQGADADRAAVWPDHVDPVGIAVASVASGGSGRTVVDLLMVNDPTQGDAAIEAVRTVADGAIELWGRPASDLHLAVSAGLGLQPHRALHRMAMDLTQRPTNELPTRSFTDADRAELLRVNNAAFAGHPDQGSWTEHDLASALDQSWVDPAGIRLFEPDGELKGFCWTKIHRYHDEPVGEIYVIGLDPTVHGQGLGAPMTAAGLAWLFDAGMRRAMLYVEADNSPAVATYKALGMDVIATDRAWRGDVIGVNRD